MKRLINIIIVVRCTFIFPRFSILDSRFSIRTHPPSFGGLDSLRVSSIQYLFIPCKTQYFTIFGRKIQATICRGHTVENGLRLKVIFSQFFAVLRRDNTQQSALVCLKGCESVSPVRNQRLTSNGVSLLSAGQEQRSTRENHRPDDQRGLLGPVILDRGLSAGLAPALLLLIRGLVNAQGPAAGSEKAKVRLAQTYVAAVRAVLVAPESIDVRGIEYKQPAGRYDVADSRPSAVTAGHSRSD